MISKCLYFDVIVSIYNCKVFGFLVFRLWGSTGGLCPEAEVLGICACISAAASLVHRNSRFKVPVGDLIRRVILPVGYKYQSNEKVKTRENKANNAV